MTLKNWVQKLTSNHGKNGVKGFILISTYHRTCPVHILGGYLQRLQYTVRHIHEVEKRFQFLF
jgi:hypothetical protein